MITQSKIGRYLLYAVGEIILVVIGILIALQINNYNQHLTNLESERSFLLEIIENLEEDKQRINKILEFNQVKGQAIDTSFYFISKGRDSTMSIRSMANQMPYLTNYEIFVPTTVAFNNISSSGSISILQSDKLRKDISRYYSNEYLNGLQNQIRITTQEFLDGAAPKLMNKNMLLNITGYEFDVLGPEEINLHKDSQILSDLYVMKNKLSWQNEFLQETKETIENLIFSIKEYLNSK